MSVVQATSNNSFKPIVGQISSSVVDNLTSSSVLSALSARQGKLLNDTKVSKIGDTLTGTLTFSGRPNGGLINCAPGGTWLANAKYGTGTPIFTTTPAGQFIPLTSTASSNGRFITATYGTYHSIAYMTQSNIDNDVNTLNNYWRFYENGIFQTPALQVGTKKVFIQASTPSGAVSGDIWIQTTM